MNDNKLIAELMEYDSYAYKTMVFMDILTDMDRNWKARFDSSEDMFGKLTDLLLGHEEWDKQNGDGVEWYKSVQSFLESEVV